VSQKPTRVLVIDDEPQIRRFLRTSLGAHDFEVIDAETGADGLRRASTEHPDVIIIDLGLPDVEGIDLVRNIREWSQVPIIVLSVRAREEDKIEALDRGADDYVTKPFGMGELLARIRAALRHKLQTAGEAPVYRSGAISVDLVKRHVTRDGAEVKLSPREYDLLRVLVQHAGRVVTHQYLLREVWGPAQEKETQYLRVYVGQIRQKLEADPAQPRLIQTEAGVGYRLAEPDIA
jgi:two-component system, OmpR family, KDP operon response regulator KdpE